ncbi:hypothetical protein N2152v2_010447 [Parachlorella kessleri]
MTVFEQPMPEAAAVRAAPKLARQSKGGGAQQQVASPPEVPAAKPAQQPSPFVRHFSREGQDRQQGTLRRLAADFMGMPGVVSLSGGFPPADLFPFESMSITLRGPGGHTVTIDDPAKASASWGHESGPSLGSGGGQRGNIVWPVAAAQQYNLALRGYQPLLRWAEEHTQQLHCPPGPHEVAITNGGNHTTEVLVSLLLDSGDSLLMEEYYYAHVLVSLLLDRGDSLLMEEYTYPHMLECVAAPKGLNVVPLPIDQQGIIPEAMEEVLERLAAQPPGTGVPFPKMLYTIPTAQNPTGATITPARRRAVYDLCSRYDILIVEDDPYYYLQFPTTPAAPHTAVPAAAATEAMLHTAVVGAEQLSELTSAGLTEVADAVRAMSAVGAAGPSPLLTASTSSVSTAASTLDSDVVCCLDSSSGSDSDGLPSPTPAGGRPQQQPQQQAWAPAAAGGHAAAAGSPAATGVAAAAAGAAARQPRSYLSLDVDGRVARVDSFAKFLSPGLRLGWITAPHDVLAKVVMCLQAHTVGPCSLSQVVVAETLAAWGEQGLQAHLRGVQEAYARRAAVMVEAAQQYTPPVPSPNPCHLLLNPFPARARRELTGLAEWATPTGGMFLWVRLLGVKDAYEVWGELQRHKLVVLPGRVMHARASDPDFHSPYVRISFSHAPEDQIREGMRRLAQVLRAYAGITS